MLSQNGKILLCLIIASFVYSSAASIELVCIDGIITNIHEPYWVYSYPDGVAGNRCYRLSPHVSRLQEPKQITLEISDYSIGAGSNLTIYSGFFPTEDTQLLVLNGTGTEITLTINSSIYFLYFYSSGGIPSTFTAKHFIDSDSM